MSERLPLFPLSTVLFPGAVLPLHVFEERYRVLVRDLLARPRGVPRTFGVVAIRAGAEAGDPRPRLHDVGCVAAVSELETLPDGRANLLTVGGARFRLGAVDAGGPYLVGEVEPLPERLGDAAAAAELARSLRRAFAAYLAALLAARGEPGSVPELPEDPLVLSHLVPATAVLDLDDKQALLAAPDAAARLAAALPLIRRERAVLARLGAVPAPELLHLARSRS